MIRVKKVKIAALPKQSAGTSFVGKRTHCK